MKIAVSTFKLLIKSNKSSVLLPISFRARGRLNVNYKANLLFIDNLIMWKFFLKQQNTRKWLLNKP